MVKKNDVRIEPIARSRRRQMDIRTPGQLEAF